MFSYNVSVQLDGEVAEEWLRWMRSEHVPEVMATGCFFDYRIFRMIDTDESQGPTYVVQYYCHTKQDYLHYLEKYAPRLRQKAVEKFKDRFVAYRSLMELV